MKKFIAVVFLVLITQAIGYTQDLNGEATWHEDILHRLDTAKQDTSRVLLIAELASYYKFQLPDSALFYGYKALTLARQIKFPKGEVTALQMIIVAQFQLGNDSKALQVTLQGLKIAEKNNLVNEKAVLLSSLGFVYNSVKNYTKALDLFRESKRLLDSLHNFTFAAFTENNIGATYLMLNQPDSALYYCESAYKNAVRLKEDWPIYGILLDLGRIQNKKGNADLALAYFRRSLSMASSASDIFNSYFPIAELYQQINNSDSCIYYTEKSLEIVKGRGFYSDNIKANVLLSNIYEKSDPIKALQYSKMAISYKDSLYDLGRVTSFEDFIAFDAQERQYEIDTANATYRSQIKQYVSIAGLMVFLLIVFILYRNNRHKQRANKILENTLENLKSTQVQLIQSEKMASLGELTAGIAHEIQNPLNFVNNFSEVNNELIYELKEEAEKGNIDEVKMIADDIKENSEKINHHGKRADAIVKNMLQHSRQTKSIKEPTNINALCDEYLRLAYHGLRAKDKSFNTDFKTDFDESIGKINIVPQDIGRVLLNLINNAFYAVNEKLTAHRSPLTDDYKPLVSVQTKKLNDKVEITVNDNGNGIPQNIVDKIFQPFFTTKPTGSGTGLGLSLSYDIIKAHGGEIKVETEAEEGTTFIIRLPVG